MKSNEIRFQRFDANSGTTLVIWVCIFLPSIGTDILRGDETLEKVDKGSLERRLTAVVDLREVEKREAVDVGSQILRNGVKNYPSHRQCFSCHHQTLPLMALSLASSNRVGSSTDDALVGIRRDIAEFTLESFGAKRDSMLEGTGVGGKALTAAYGLWGLDLARVPRNETTDAMVEYLIRVQQPNGAWSFQSFRPPASASLAMTTAIAVLGLRSYAANTPRSERAHDAIANAQRWLNSIAASDGQDDELKSHEGLIGAAWLASQLHDETLCKKLVDRIVVSQREDGGWAQEATMECDAYATGQSVLLLAQLQSLGIQVPDGEGVRRRAQLYLLRTQLKDGSWFVETRAKPVQIFFDNGDPHGKHQFISMMATSWAVAALSIESNSGAAPLDSFWAAQLGSDAELTPQ